MSGRLSTLELTLKSHLRENVHDKISFCKDLSVSNFTKLCAACNSSVVCTSDDETQVGGTHLQAMLLQLGHLKLQTLVLPIKLVSHYSHLARVQVVHDLF